MPPRRQCCPLLIFITAILLAITSAPAQVILSKPKQSEPDAVILVRYLAIMTPEKQIAELTRDCLDTNVLRQLGFLAGLSQSELNRVGVFHNPSRKQIELYQLGWFGSNKPIEVMERQLSAYGRCRSQGHTKNFTLAAFADRARVKTLANKSLLPLLTNHSCIALAWLRTNRSGFKTNIAGQIVSRTTTITEVNGRWFTNETVKIPTTNEICPWVEYIAIDGDIAWSYLVEYNADHSFNFVYPKNLTQRISTPNTVTSWPQWNAR